MKVNEGSDLLLGKTTNYVASYAPELLCPIARSTARLELGIEQASPLPFRGNDIWNAYELSWLNARGKPMVACAEFSFPCDSPAIIESKSLKLYLNSLNQTRYQSIEQLRDVLVADLSACVKAPVTVVIKTAEQWTQQPEPSVLGACLDDQDIAADCYQPDSALLNTVGDEMANEVLYSHLLRSLCPVTGQPDWGTIVIRYRGKAICHQGLLKYIVSYREHQDFHEHCVEKIFFDIMRRCEPEALSVSAHYVRRGGLDINPHRTTEEMVKDNVRLYRQ